MWSEVCLLSLSSSNQDGSGCNLVSNRRACFVGLVGTSAGKSAFWVLGWATITVDWHSRAWTESSIPVQFPSKLFSPRLLWDVPAPLLVLELLHSGLRLAGNCFKKGSSTQPSSCFFSLQGMLDWAFALLPVATFLSRWTYDRPSIKTRRHLY